jgi:membrane-associated phospholipid phosphatase
MESPDKLLAYNAFNLAGEHPPIEDHPLMRSLDSLNTTTRLKALLNPLSPSSFPFPLVPATVLTPINGSSPPLDPGVDKDSLIGIGRESALVDSLDPITPACSPDANGEVTIDPPDLIGTIDDVKMPPISDCQQQDDTGHLKVFVTNQGEQPVTEPLAINLYASTDDILDSNDELLTHEVHSRAQLSPAHVNKYTLDFTNPVSVAPGAYHLITKIDPDNAIAESDETNNADSIRVSADGTDVVLDWNATLLNAIVTDRTAPPMAARNMAMVHTAIYDAVTIAAQPGISQEAAAAAAAYRILLNLYPTQGDTFDIQLTSSLAEIPDSLAEIKGAMVGWSAADAVLASRCHDGANTPVQYHPGTAPGDWQPTPPDNLPALLPQWGQVTPFAMSSGSQFRPDGPPALDSAKYVAEFNQVKALGSLNSTTRTAEQTEIAKFWADGAGTFTPPGHWNLIAEQIALTKGNTLEENARLFALLDIAEADAGIAAWDAKYTYNLWRPITAIALADTDNNPDTSADPDWTPLLTTPPFPEYVSGHSTFSGAAATVLTAFFGDNLNFATASIGLPNVVRSFSSFTQAANEAGMSRIYGGIHFQSANQDGLAMGRAVGNYAIRHWLATTA